MEVVKEILSPCQVSLQINVEPVKVAEAVDKAYREFSRYVQVPGFRKGKAPMSFVKARVPEAQLRERTAELLVQPAYKAAIEKESVEPYAAPDLELVNLDIKPDEQKFEFKALVPLAPKVELCEYIGMPVDMRRPVVDDAVVDRFVKQITESSATYPTVTDRPSEIGDLLATETAVTPEGEDPAEPKSRIFEIGDAANPPGLDEQLVGLSEGEDKSFILTYPPDWREEELAGTTAGYFVTVSNIHKKNIPVFDAEFAKSRFEVDTVEEARVILRDRLVQQGADRALRAAEVELLSKIIAGSRIDFPNVMLVEQVREDVRGFMEGLTQNGIELNDYLAREQTTEEQIAKDAEAVANVKIRNMLVLTEIARREEIKVEQEDFDREVAAFAAEHNIAPQAYLTYAKTTGQTNAIVSTALSKKILGFLLDKAIINEVVAPVNARAADADGKDPVAPADEAIAASVAPAKKSRAKKAAKERTEE